MGLGGEERKKAAVLSAAEKRCIYLRKRGDVFSVLLFYSFVVDARVSKQSSRLPTANEISTQALIGRYLGRDGHVFFWALTLAQSDEGGSGGPFQDGLGIALSSPIFTLAAGQDRRKCVRSTTVQQSAKRCCEMFHNLCLVEAGCKGWAANPSTDAGVKQRH